MWKNFNGNFTQKISFIINNINNTINTITIITIIMIIIIIFIPLNINLLITINFIQHQHRQFLPSTGMKTWFVYKLNFVITIALNSSSSLYIIYFKQEAKSSWNCFSNFSSAFIINMILMNGNHNNQLITPHTQTYFLTGKINLFLMKISR